MKFKLLLSASLLALCGAASAQTAVEITDPARIAEIERHAQQLGAQGSQSMGSQSMGSSAMGAPMAGEGGDRMQGKHMRGHRKHMMRHEKMHGKRAAMRPQPDMAAPAAPASPPPPPSGQN